MPPSSATRPRLTYVTDAEPGYRRRRSGRGFRYFDAHGRNVRDPKILDRIHALAVPPAYRDVWICKRADGHLQATGVDARGRKQYRYHPLWKAMRGAEKFRHVATFGRSLPRLRRALRRDLALDGFPKQKVLATVIAIMARTYLRVGNNGYTRENHSYGLTTLRNSHARALAGGRVKLAFRGKSGVVQESIIDDTRLAMLIRRCQELPGQRLFQYRDDQGKLRPIGSTDVNDYLRDAMEGEFTAKDFRTWGGTLMAIRLLAQRPPKGKHASEAELTKIRTWVESGVAKQLNNTPAVCRSSYIDPRVYHAWANRWLAQAAQGVLGQRQWEALVVKLLNSK
ncbi:DNA topoisomerase IB [Solilutibacter silvestris]|uniref:DNA topoisomerase n=1 Tax=Solilutibacter silvestris TaxID=1645665 RepID=A0A2K1Q381_9GAMM|nr:DNA topoisomerase IB [Lysobacter silvestris]PNS09502.1 Topoisomerase IB [Lysobacter silvestris]